MNIFDTLEQDERWLGFGYLGGRHTALTSTDSECPANPALVAEVDAWILEQTSGWTADEIFTWANSRPGRHFADVAFSDPAWRTLVTRWNLLVKVAA